MPPGRALGRSHGMLIMLLLVALGLRLHAIDWQLPARFHPDEPPHVDMAISQAVRGDFSGQYINQPPLYRHLITLELLALDRLGLLGGSLYDTATLKRMDDPAAGHVIARAYIAGRATSALLGAATVGVLFLAVRGLFGSPAALLSALALALSLSHVRESHFATTTVTALFFAAAAFYWSVRSMAGGSALNLIPGFLAAGLAVATRDLLIVSVVFPTAALLMRAPRVADPRWWLAIGLAVPMIIAATVLLFQAVTPYQSVGVLSQGLPPLPKTSTEPLTMDRVTAYGSYYLGFLAQSLGVPLLIAAAVGAIQLARRQLRTLLMIAAYGLAIAVALITNRYEAGRFVIPLELALAALAGPGIVWTLSALRTLTNKRAFHGVALAVLFGGPAFNALAYNWVVTQPDTRTLAYRWAQEHLPPSSIVYSAGLSLTGAQADQAPPGRVTTAWMPADHVATAFTGAGCGEVVALSRDAGSGVDLPIEGAGASARAIVEARGAPVARFSGRRWDDMDLGPDETFGPFWRLWNVQRPGPMIELFEITPNCVAEPPRHPAMELLAVSDDGSSMDLWLIRDPRFAETGASVAFRSDRLPQQPRALALGRFIPGDATLSAAVLWQESGQDVLGLYRLSQEHPPQLVMLDRAEIVACRCISSQGFAAIDLDGDGVDELAALGVTEGVEWLRAFSLAREQPRRLWERRIDSGTKQAAVALSAGPADGHGPARLGLLYAIGNDYQLHVLDPSLTDVPLGRYRLPAGGDGLLPVMSMGDMDGNGVNDVALLDASRRQAHLFRLPPSSSREPEMMTVFQRRAVAEGTRLLQTVPSTPLIQDTLPAVEILAIDQAERDLALLGLAFDEHSSFPLRLADAPTIELPERRTVLGLTSGRFIAEDPWPSVVVMFQRGRNVSLEMHRRNADGRLTETSVELDRWRSGEDERPVRNSLAAVDLDGDGVDELVSGRADLMNQERQELQYHRLTLWPKPAATFLEVDREVIPEGAELSAITRLPGAINDSAQLALAYRMGGSDFLATIDVRTGQAGALRTVQTWGGPTDGRVIGLATAPNGADRPALVIADRLPDRQRLIKATIAPDGTFHPTLTARWPDLRHELFWISPVQ